MATNDTETVAELVLDALLELEVQTLGQSVDPGQQAHAIRVMQRMMKGWQQEHGTPFHLLASQSLTLTTAASYTLPVERPIRIFSARLKRDGIETPMVELTRQEYDDLPDKTTMGSPTQFYYDRQKENALFYVWPLLSAAAGETVEITYERETEDLVSGDVVDAPVEWYEAIVKGLAARLIGTYGRERTKAYLREDAKASLDRALGAGVDGTSVYWAPGRA